MVFETTDAGSTPAQATMAVKKETTPQKALDLHPKVVLSALAGSLTVIVLYVLNSFGIDPPAEVGAAITTLITFAAGWLAPNAPAE